MNFPFFTTTMHFLFDTCAILPNIGHLYFEPYKTLINGVLLVHFNNNIDVFYTQNVHLSTVSCPSLIVLHAVILRRPVSNLVFFTFLYPSLSINANPFRL